MNKYYKSQNYDFFYYQETIRKVPMWFLYLFRILWGGIGENKHIPIDYGTIDKTNT